MASGRRESPEPIVRGRKWFEDLASGRAQSLIEIAEEEDVTDRYVGQLILLDIVAGILSETQSVDLTTETLTRRIDFPLAWEEQRALLGFD